MISVGLAVDKPEEVVDIVVVVAVVDNLESFVVECAFGEGQFEAAFEYMLVVAFEIDGFEFGELVAEFESVVAVGELWVILMGLVVAGAF